MSDVLCGNITKSTYYHFYTTWLRVAEVSSRYFLSTDYFKHGYKVCEVKNAFEISDEKFYMQDETSTTNLVNGEWSASAAASVRSHVLDIALKSTLAVLTARTESDCEHDSA